LAPWILIGVLGLVGLVLRGFVGLLLGLVAGVVFALLIGTVYNTIQGGGVPRRVRRTLAVNLIAKHSDVIARALPGLQGQALIDRLEELIEQIGSHAARHAPLPQHLWTETAVTLGLADMIALAPNDDLRDLYRCMLERIRQEWYAVNYLRGMVEP